MSSQFCRFFYHKLFTPDIHSKFPHLLQAQLMKDKCNVMAAIAKNVKTYFNFLQVDLLKKYCNYCKNIFRYSKRVAMVGGIFNVNFLVINFPKELENKEVLTKKEDTMYIKYIFSFLIVIGFENTQ